MDFGKIFILMMTIAIFAISYVRNKDLLSPVKIYVAYSFFFYVGFYSNAVLWETFYCYAALIASIGVSLFFEPSVKSVSKPINFLRRNNFYYKIWAFTIPGIAVKLYLIVEAGGIFEYLSSLVFRVRDWAGQGHLLIWFYIIPVINLVYFSEVIYSKNKSFSIIFGYVCHFCVFLLIGLMTGSRSYIAITILGMLFVYSYIVKPVKIVSIAIFGISLMLLAGFIGAARNNFDNIGSESFFSSATSIGEFESTQLSYGIIPLEIIFGSAEHENLLGETYLSILTNYIPRGIYPSKPDTGGIAFTKIYMDDQWGGLSNLATGSVTEAVMNFGIIFGVPFGIVLNFLLFMIGCFLYRKTIVCSKGGFRRISTIHIVMYYYSILSIARFSFAEFTDILQSLVFYALIPCFVFFYFSREKSTNISKGS
jgi:oligosaccharide repeat unit polymerase